MSDTSTSHNTEQLRNAVRAIAKLQARVHELETSSDRQSEPVAVIGLACRFPGGCDSPESFWTLLREGRDGIREVPPDRWDVDAYYHPDPGAPGKICTRHGGFLERVDLFDADLFGIAPREAGSLDPQHRLLLEMSWEALERAGQTPGARVGSRTGVFMGLSTSDYGQLLAAQGEESIDAYLGTGVSHSAAAGRISYLLGLEGPNMAIDTACSSSLVAVHLACKSLLSRESDLALAGGVNVILTPLAMINFSQARMLAPDGRCKAFDAAADGYVRSEGCGVVVLKRLSDAQRDGDPVLALIRGTAVNQDGASSGLTVPNGRAQERVIREALAWAGVEPRDVAYLEAHGTGTSLGDPIEIAAAGAVYGEGREPGRPLYVGAVKTNIGHLEAAAGMAGLIKTVLALQNPLIPRQLHFQRPNPHIVWDPLPLRVAADAVPWPPGRRIAGVSAFSFAGTNAHVVLEAAPPVPVRGRGPRERSHHLLPLSGRDAAALAGLASRYLELLEDHPALDPVDLADIAYTAGAGRAHLEERAALVIGSAAEARDLLGKLNSGEVAAGLFLGRARSRPKTAWLFPGQGSQYAGMARELYDTQPVFRNVLERCDRGLAGKLEQPLLDVLFEEKKGNGAESLLDQTRYTQPVLFAVEVALAELWRSWGLEPDVVLGHSVGEYAAAVVAGVFSLEEGLTLIARRAELMGRLPAGGAMAAIFADAETVQRELAGEPELALAADNGAHVVVSGPSWILETLLARLAGRGLRCRPLATAYAFHSALMEPVLDELEAAAGAVQFRPAQQMLVCNLTGRPPAAGQVLEALYWRRHAREPVQFAESIRTLAAERVGVLLEVGPQAVLLGMASRCWPEPAPRPAMIPSLRHDTPEGRQIAEAAARLYVQGAGLDFISWDRPWPRRKRTLPTYPFQRRRYWVRSAPSARPGPAAGTVADYYDALLQSQQGEAATPFLTFGPLPHRVAGFSWVRAMGRPREYPEQAALLRRAQQEMREALFSHVRFEEVSSALDIGCGMAGDLVTLAKAYPHLKLHGYTLSKEQADYGRRRLVEHGVAPRVEIFHRDSAEEEFPAQYQLVFGFEVVHHVRNKARLFSNIEKHLDDGGFLVLADFLSTLDTTLEHDETSSYFSTLEEWVQLLATHRLLLIEAVDISHEVANLLWDPEFEAHSQEIAEGAGGVDPNVAAAARSYHQLGRMLDKGIARYLLLTARKESASRWVDADHANRSKLQNLVPYSRRRGRQLLYQLEWRLRERTAAGEPDRGGNGYWLLFTGGDAVGRSLAARLASRQQPCFQVVAADAYSGTGPGEFRIRAAEEGDYLRLLSDLRKRAGERLACRGIVHLWARPGEPGEEPSADQLAASQDHGSRSVLHLARAVESLPEWRSVPFWILTQGAQAVQEDEAPVDVAHATLWGLGRVISLERPHAPCVRIDLGAAPSESELDLLAEELGSPGQEEEIALRGGRRYAARISPLAGQELDGAAVRVREDGTYLITGGRGALGLATAEWLIARGARSIVLLGRQPAGPEVEARIRELSSLGCVCRSFEGDVGQEEQLAVLLAELRRSMAPLRGVFHAAGTLADGVLAQQSGEHFEEVLWPKLRGGWSLHRQTRQDPLDFFVLYSSAVAVLGAPGQANYAAANAFLDALAHYRRRLGLPALAVGWGLWADGGMAKSSPQVVRAYRARGGELLEKAEAFRSLERLLAGGPGHALVAALDGQRFGRQTGTRTPALIAEILPPAGEPVRRKPSPLHRLERAAPSERRTLLRAYLRRQVMQVLQLATPPDEEAGFFDLGMDSLMAVELRNRLQNDLVLDPPPPTTIAFDYPSVHRLAEHLLEQGAGGGRVETAVCPPPVPSPLADAAEPIALVGMACRFPGAGDVEAFWQLLEAGRDAVREVPPERWDADAYYDPDPEAPGKMYTRDGGFLDQVDQFEPAFFGLSPREAASLDPQHRLLLEVTWEALEHAGIAPAGLMDSRTGVFMGLSTSDYAQLLALAGGADKDPYFATGTAHSTGVGRISHILGLQGPNQAIDTACSSSLVAVSQACDSLRSSRCDLALAGGANAILSPAGMIHMSKTRMLSPDGRCRTFDARANGYVRGEGCGVVVLKRLSDARRDGDAIHAVIRGWAVNHDGASSGLTVPNGPAQERVIREALEQAGLHSSEVDYLEAHGTGTSLGDPIEVQAAGTVFGQGRDPGRRLLLGSVKTNIGHLEAAAGVAGLIKVVLSMNRDLIPKHLHFETPSPHVEWHRLAVQVTAEPTQWPRQERVAGVSSFGFSGTNAHLVVAAPPPAPAQPEAEGAQRDHHLLPLSARSREALNMAAGRYSRWLENHPEADLRDVCFTAATGRSHLEHRACLVVTSTADAQALLGTLRDGATAPGLFVGTGRTRATCAWLFPGLPPDDGAAVLTGAARLLGSLPVFRERIRQFSPLESAASALFAVEMALAELWLSFGFEPDVVMGDGLGCYAAAAVAGVLSPDDGFRLIVEQERLEGVELRPAERSLLCGVTGEVLSPGRLLDASYWRDPAGKPAELPRCMASLAGLGCGILLELGPDSSLLDLVPACWPEGVEMPVRIPSLGREGDGERQIAEAVARLHVHGLTPDFAAWDRPWPRRKVALPGYPFERRRHWIQAASGERLFPAPARSERGRQQERVKPGEDGVRELVEREVQQVLALSEVPGPRQDFLEMGMDSMVATELTGRLEKSFGVTLSSTAVLDHRSVSALAAHVAGRLTGAGEREALQGTGRRPRAQDGPGTSFWRRQLGAPAAPAVEKATGIGPSPVPLWRDGAPGSLGSGPEDQPTVRVYSPPAGSATGTGVVLCPGGGYAAHAMDTEGHQVARWLNTLGITAVLLRYRLAPRYRYPAPLDDLRRAVRYVRSRADDFGLAPHRIGVMGFSAGGHLAAMLATRSDPGDAVAEDPVERNPCRPDFLILGYPVISFTEPVSVVTRRNLLGEDPDPVLFEALSAENHVSESTPPTFLFHTGEDAAVPVEHSLAFYRALRRARVPAELHIYTFGPHGMGLAAGDPVLASWKDRLADWLRNSGFQADVERAAVQGEVTVNGTAVAFGTITFTPVDAAGTPTVCGHIHRGAYTIPAHRGPVVGESRVEIRILGGIESEPTVDDVVLVEGKTARIARGENVVPFHLDLSSRQEGILA